MSAWGNVDLANNKPKYINTSSWPFNTNANVFSANAATVATVAKGTHPGWILKRVGSGGRAGRTQYEVLVAMNSIVASGNNGNTVVVS